MSASIFLYLFAFFAGLAGASFYAWPASIWACFSAIAVALFVRRWRLFFLVLAVFCLGVWRASVLPPADLFLVPFLGKPASDWQFQVCTDPEPAWDKQIVILCMLEKSSGKLIKGKIIAYLPLYPRVYYGDFLDLHCRLEKPPVFSDFDYAAFLAARGVGAICAWPQVNYWERADTNQTIFSRLFVFKREVLQQINQSLPEPAAGLASALLLGYKKTLFPAENLIWQKAGLSHLVAISGGHITLFLSLLISLLVYLGMSKRFALWPALSFASAYVFLTGWQASALRSLLMGGILLYAWRRGRLSSAWGPLLLAGAIMLWNNPGLWRYDLGFQLSFLAIAGIIVFYPLFTAIFEKYFFHPYLRLIFEAFSLSLSAQLTIWPLLAWKSGGVSLIAPFSNILAFSVFSPLMISLISSLACNFICGFFELAWLPAKALLDYLLFLARLAATLPGAYVETPHFSLPYVAAYYFSLILFFSWRRYIQTKSRQSSADQRKKTL
ncbi:MAG: ComEC/Rec2 family competence protein [Patescibacteria group bacterium]|nr:ComEC/Rec2 family competence protein [Patescibacteria group bacterium]